MIYNDSGLLSSGVNLASLEVFNYFKTPFGIGRNTFLGENTYTVNLALFKTTRISERFKVELRGEATNLFNRRTSALLTRWSKTHLTELLSVRFRIRDLMSARTVYYASV